MKDYMIIKDEPFVNPIISEFFNELLNLGTEIQHCIKEKNNEFSVMFAY